MPGSPTWFHRHRAVQTAAIFLMATGFIIVIIALGTPSSSNHAIIGFVVLFIGFLQPLNACIRPHNPDPGEPRPFKRVAWEFLHKNAGRFAVIMGIFNVFYGALVVGPPYISKTATTPWFFIVLLVVVGMVSVTGVGLEFKLMITESDTAESEKRKSVCSTQNGADDLRPSSEMSHLSGFDFREDDNHKSGPVSTEANPIAASGSEKYSSAPARASTGPMSRKSVVQAV